MRRLRIRLLLAALAAPLAAGPLDASCVQSEPNRVATLEVESCRDAASALRQRTEGDLRRYREGRLLLGREPGVVVTGRVSRKVHVTQRDANDFRVEDVVTADEAGTWFVPVPAPPNGTGTDACAAYAKGAAVELYVVEPCCDTVPPSEPACLLAVGAASPVPAALAKAVATFLTRSDSQ